MTFVVDWAIDPTGALAVVSEEAIGELPSMARPGGVCVTVNGAVVVSEPEANRLRWTEPGGRSLLIGGMPGCDDGAPSEASFRHPLGVAAAPDGSVVVADAENHAIRRVEPDGWVTTVAGGRYGAVDGRGHDARFRSPRGVAVTLDGTVLVADTVNDTVRRVGTDGVVTTMAGGIYGHGDIDAGRVAFRQPEALAVGSDGTVYVADTGNDRVVSISPSGQARLVAGRRAPGRSLAPAPDLRWPTSLAVNVGGTLYVTDAGANAVRRVGPDGASAALLSDPDWQPVALSLSADGRVLVAEARWTLGHMTGRLLTVEP
jgi:DNA-binding beta-propeller fold protein YncE